MEVIYTSDARVDLDHWRNSGNRTVQTKISSLIASMLETPFEGLGKPEALKYDLKGRWSRRINREHRIIYAVVEGQIEIYSLRGHYKKQ
jgi:toxin YoeB